MPDFAFEEALNEPSPAGATSIDLDPEVRAYFASKPDGVFYPSWEPWVVQLHLDAKKLIEELRALREALVSPTVGPPKTSA